MTSFLNMGGALIDLGTSYHYSEGISRSDEKFISEIEDLLVIEAAKKRGLSLKEASMIPGRARRAKRAATLALTLAAADGPLPIGDILAIGVLGGYAAYESYTIVKDMID